MMSALFCKSQNPKLTIVNKKLTCEVNKTLPKKEAVVHLNLKAKYSLLCILDRSPFYKIINCCQIITQIMVKLTNL